MTGCYLTFNQGVTEVKQRYGRRGGLEALRKRAEALRAFCAGLPSLGFSLDGEIDLRTSGLGADYEGSTVAYKLYEAGAVPTDEEILRDVGAVLEAYNGYLEAEGKTGLSEGEKLDDGVEVPTADGRLLELAQATNLPIAELKKIESLLLEKQQIIFEGPPGSGKTYLAEKFSRYFTSNPLSGDLQNDRVRIVQFHQSYGYEDFIQGYRPVANVKMQGDEEHSHLEYQLRNGIFKDLCEIARADPDSYYVMIIDEINRGNISRIFGELLFLLEYRNKQVALAYGEPKKSSFSIPKNIYLIGTMNTTDRSLALIDYALRRRFYFYRMMPVVDGRAPILESWLQNKDIPPSGRQAILRLFINLNERIKKHLGEHFQVGHSYFMREDIGDPEAQRRMWEYSVLPLLEEYFYNARDMNKVLSEFSIENLLHSEE